MKKQGENVENILAILLTRAAGGKSKNFCPTNPSWACAYAPKMEEATRV
jgi:hypothetical protein